MTTTNDAETVVVDHLIGPRGRLAVRIAAAEIRLTANDGDHVVVRTPNGAPLSDRVVIETADGCLTIREKEILGITLSFGRKVVQLEISVPAYADIAIDTASGWLDGQGLRGEQRYRMVSAETRLRGGAGRIELNTVSGDATFELADAADLTVKSVSGDVAVHGGRLDSLRVATTSGDVRIDSPIVGRVGNAIETLSGDVSVVATSGMRVDARTVSGDLMSDLPHRSEGRAGRRTLIVGDGSIELGFRSVSGDLRVRDDAGGHVADRPLVHGDAAATPAWLPRPVRPVRPVTPVMPAMPAVPPTPPMPGASGTPAPGTSGTSGPAVGPATADDPAESERMTILRALERGDLDVATALDRMAALDGPGDGAREPSDA